MIYDGSSTVYQNTSISSQVVSPSPKDNFNTRLRRLFKNISQTMTSSNTVLLNAAEKSESNLPSDTLRMSKSSVAYQKQSNGDQSNHNNRTENEYIIMPSLDDSDTLDGSKLEEIISNEQKLNQVDKMDNPNHVITLTRNSNLSPIDVSESEEKRNKIGINNRDSEIYQSIGDIEAYSNARKASNLQIPSSDQNALYSTPINTRNDFNSETPVNVKNYSSMKLFNDDDQDTSQA